MQILCSLMMMTVTFAWWMMTSVCSSNLVVSAFLQPNIRRRSCLSNPFRNHSRILRAVTNIDNEQEWVEEFFIRRSGLATATTTSSSSSSSAMDNNKAAFRGTDDASYSLLAEGDDDGGVRGGDENVQHHETETSRIHRSSNKNSNLTSQQPEQTVDSTSNCVSNDDNYEMESTSMNDEKLLRDLYQLIQLQQQKSTDTTTTTKTTKTILKEITYRANIEIKNLCQNQNHNQRHHPYKQSNNNNTNHNKRKRYHNNRQSNDEKYVSSTTTTTTNVRNTYMTYHPAHTADKILNMLEQVNAADTISYNGVINAYAKSSLDDSAQQAERILKRMKKVYQCQLDNRQRWINTSNTMEKEEEEEGEGEEEEEPVITVKPNFRTYSTVIDAYSRATYADDTAAENAQSLYEHLKSLYESTGFEDQDLKPNTILCNSVINAWAKTGTMQGAQNAVKILETMEKEGIVDVISYNAVIHAWARCGSDESGERAESILRRMIKRSSTSTTTTTDATKPNIRTYSSIIDAWSRSNHPGAAQRAQMILEEMEKRYRETGDDTLKPNTVAYSTVINAHARSRDMEHKAPAALRVLKHMQYLYESGENVQAKPTIVSYNSVLNACATTYGAIGPNHRDQDDNEDLGQNYGQEGNYQKFALDTVKSIYEELSTPKSKIRPDHFTYGTILKACANLMPGDEEASLFIRQVFEQCCKDGQVAFGVCFQLRQAAPADLYRELIPLEAIDETNGHFQMNNLPQSWRRNVTEKKRFKRNS